MLGLKRSRYVPDLSLKFQNNYSSILRKTAVMSLAISAVSISGFQQVLACKKVSYVKVSNLYKWWKFTLHIIFFFFEGVVTTR